LGEQRRGNSAKKSAPGVVRAQIGSVVSHGHKDISEGKRPPSDGSLTAAGRTLFGADPLWLRFIPKNSGLQRFALDWDTGLGVPGMLSKPLPRRRFAD
jgi:hypothetical protein